MLSGCGRYGLISVLALLATACASSGSAGSASGEAVDSTATVVRVIDGDSVELELNGDVVESRLIGINAPEFADCQGPMATEALRNVIEGQELTVTTFGKDRFDRELVELELNGQSVNQKLVSAGWALAHHNDEGTQWLGDMESAAKGGLGMWDLPDTCEPSSDDVVISDIEPNPPGPDDEVLEDEWIEIHNRGTEAVNLSGWTLRDESTSNRYVFGNVSLGADQRLKLRTGCGDSSATDIYWCSNNGVWSNRGETALLLSPSGAIVDYLFIDG